MHKKFLSQAHMVEMRRMTGYARTCSVCGEAQHGTGWTFFDKKGIVIGFGCIKHLDDYPTEFRRLEENWQEYVAVQSCRISVENSTDPIVG